MNSGGIVITYEADSDVVARYMDYFREEFKLDFRLSKAEVTEVMNERVRYLERLKTLSATVDAHKIEGFKKGLWEKSKIWNQIQRKAKLSPKGKFHRTYEKWEPDQVEFIRDRLGQKDSILRDRLNRTYGTYHTLLAVRHMKRRLRQ